VIPPHVAAVSDRAMPSASDGLRSGSLSIAAVAEEGLPRQIIANPTLSTRDPRPTKPREPGSAAGWTRAR